MEINNAQHDTKTEVDNNQLTTNVTQLARMISLVIKQVKSDQPDQPEQVRHSLKEEESLIFQTLGGHGVSMAEVVQKSVNATEAVTDTDNDELPAELAEKVIQSNRNGTLSLEDIFPALFGDQPDSYSTHVLLDYLAPKTIPFSTFETSYTLSPTSNNPEYQISHDTDSQIIIIRSKQVMTASQQTPNSVNDTDNSSSSFLTANDDNYIASEDNTMSGTVATNDSTTSGGTLSFALDTDVSNGTLVFNNNGSFDYTPDTNFNGSDSFSYTVTDNDSAESATQTVSLTVDPVADLTATDDSFSSNEDSILSDSVASNDSTSSGGTLSFTLNTDVSNGTLVFNHNGSFDYTPDSNFNGSDAFSYTVTDNDSAESATHNVSLYVDPVTDLSAADDNFTTNEDTPLSDSVATNDSTSSGGTLSFALDTDVSNGTLVFNHNGSFNYTPDTNFNGLDSFSYSVTDTDSAESATQTVSLNVDSVADLTATDDSFTINEDSTLSDSVANNDSTTSGGTLSFALDTNVSNGTLVLNNNGSFDYTPDSNFNGADSFSYTVTDNDSAESAIQTVNLTVDPVIDLSAADDNFTTNEDTPLSDSVATNDSTSSGGTLGFVLGTDVSNGTLVFNHNGSFDYTPDTNFTGSDSFSYTVTDANSGESSNQTVNLTVQTPGAIVAAGDSFTLSEDSVLNGDVSTNDSTSSGGSLIFAVDTDVSEGILSLSNDGTFSYTPNSNYNGSDGFTYSVTDTLTSQTRILAVSLNITATTDLSAADDSFSSNEDSTLTDSVAINDSTTSGGTLSFVLDTDVSNGSLVFNNNGSFDYTPDSNFNGVDSFGYTVTDADSGESSTQTVNLTVDAVADLTAADDSFSTNEDTTLSDSVATNDSTSSGGTLSFVLDTDVSNGSLVFNNNGSFDYTPDSNFNGVDSFSYTVTDADSGESATLSVSLSVEPVADLAAVDDSFNTDEDSLITNSVATNDSTTSGGNLTYSLVTGPYHGNLTLHIDGSFSYDPDDNYNGTEQFIYEVTDLDANEKIQKSVTIVVNPVDDPPEVQLENSSLLGLIDISAAGILDFGNQDINSVDADGDLQSIEIKYTALLGLGAYTLSASTVLANELGLQLTIVNEPGVLGVIDPSSTLTISDVGGGVINNLAVNELLASVQFNSGGSVISSSLLTLNVLSATTITAVDAQGNTDSSNISSLIDVSALDTLLGDNSIQQGTNGDDTLTGTADTDRIYGLDGNDDLQGNDGQDLLRGGAGNDLLSGGNGSDLLIGGQGDDELTGGDAADVFRWESNDQGTTVSPAVDNITDFSSVEGDVLDLRDILVGEESGDLLDYLDFSLVGDDTQISVSSDGSGDVTQIIRLDNVDLTSNGSLSDQQVLDNLLSGDNLLTD